MNENICENECNESIYNDNDSMLAALWPCDSAFQYKKHYSNFQNAKKLHSNSGNARNIEYSDKTTKKHNKWYFSPKPLIFHILSQ